MNVEMHGKVALVTGGASGIGRVAAQLFAQEGARVVVTADANSRGAEETVNLIKDAVGEATFIRCDVSKAGDIEALVAGTVEKYGFLDYAFNAGTEPDGKRVPVVPMVDMLEGLRDRHIETDLTGVFLCTKYELRQMIKQNGGSIVNTSSTGALKAAPGSAAYDASRTRLFGLVKAAALEVAQFGIRINTISPGPTGSTLLMDDLTAWQRGINERFHEIVPMQRVTELDEMAQAVVWLCSDAAGFLNGQELSVDDWDDSVVEG
jgi:NAD(P)-dependent dehydrogenase (short-subunit alcohol dehydrogenase family)